MLIYENSIFKFEELSEKSSKQFDSLIVYFTCDILRIGHKTDRVVSDLAFFKGAFIMAIQKKFL